MLNFVEQVLGGFLDGEALALGALESFGGGIVITKNPDGATAGFLALVRIKAFLALVEHVAVFPIAHEADERAFEGEELGIALRADPDVSGAAAEAVEGVINGFFDFALGAGVTANINDRQALWFGWHTIHP